MYSNVSPQTFQFAPGQILDISKMALDEIRLFSAC